MTLTPSSFRLDLKCGKGSISEGEKCTKGPATKAQSERSIKAKTRSNKAQRNLRRATIVGIGALTLGTGIALGVRQKRMNRSFAAELAARAVAQRQRIRTMERQQQQAATSVENATDFMRGYGFSTRHSATTGSSSPRGGYSPPVGSTEWKISQAFNAQIKHRTSRSRNPNPDVSAAWAKARIKTSSTPYKGDPDVSAAFTRRRDSVFADGFYPDTYDI